MTLSALSFPLQKLNTLKRLLTLEPSLNMQIGLTKVAIVLIKTLSMMRSIANWMNPFNSQDLIVISPFWLLNISL